MNSVREQENQVVRIKYFAENSNEYGVWLSPKESRETEDDCKRIKRPFQTALMPEKFRFSVSRVMGGICLDCNKKRCPVCNGCPMSDKELETGHCQRCICLPHKRLEEPLNETGVPIDVLIRKRQGFGWENKK